MGGKKAVEKNREWEKGRRDKLNQSFNELSKLLPDHDPSITLSKMEILNRAAMYIKTLQKQNRDILNDGKQTFLDEEVDRLQKRVAHLVFKTKLLVDALRNAGVPIPEVKPPKSRNRKKQESKVPPASVDKTVIPNVSGEQLQGLEEPLAVPEGAIILSDGPLKEIIQPSKNSLKCASSSLKALEDSLKLADEANKSSGNLCKTKDFIKVSKEPLKEINSTLPSVSIPKDIPSVSQAPQPPPISVAVKEQPLLTGSLPGVITSINQGQSSTLPNFTFLDRSLVNLGPGTLILADGRVVNVPPPVPQIVVKPQPTLILMQKTVRREKRLYPKPKQVDVTKTTFTNKAPIPTIKHFNFEFKTKRSRIKVTKTRLSPKQIKKKEPAKSKVVAKSNLVKIDGEMQVEMNKSSKTFKSGDTVKVSKGHEGNDTHQNKDNTLVEEAETTTEIVTECASVKRLEQISSDKSGETETVTVENSKTVSKLMADTSKSVADLESKIVATLVSDASQSVTELDAKVVSKLVSDVSQSVADLEPITVKALNLNENIVCDDREKCVQEIGQNNFGDNQLKHLDHVITSVQDTDNMLEKQTNITQNNNSLIITNEEELQTLPSVNSGNNMITDVNVCISPNHSFDSEMNIQNNDVRKQSSNSNCIPDKSIEFTKVAEVVSLQNKCLTETLSVSNQQSNPPLNSRSKLNDNPPTATVKKSEINLSQLTNNKNIQNKVQQNAQSCSTSDKPLEDKDNGSFKKLIVPFHNDSTNRSYESNLQTLGTNNHLSVSSNQDSLRNSDRSLNCNKQFQNAASNSLGNIQNKTANEKSFTGKNIRQEESRESRNKGHKNSTQSTISNEGNNVYFINPNIVPIGDKSNKDFFSSRQSIDNCHVETFSNQTNVNVNKITYNPESNQCNNTMPEERYSGSNTAIIKGDYNCKDKRIFDVNNQNLNKASFNVLSNNSSVSTQNQINQPFVNLNKESYATQNCCMTRNESYITGGNCDMMKESFSSSTKSPCKEMLFVNYLNNPVSKSTYPEQANLSLPKDSYGNRCSMKNYLNQVGSVNHQAMYTNQYNSLNNTFISQNNTVYNKEAFTNQCEPFTYVNQESTNKDNYSGQIGSLNKDLYASQTNSAINKTVYSNQNSLLNKDSCVTTNSSISKDSYREKTMSLANQCNVLNKDPSYPANKECYVNTNKDSFTNQNPNITRSLNKDSYSSTGSSNKNLDSNQTGSISKDSMTNTTSAQRSSLNKISYENQKSSTADKACQPEMPLCRNISTSEFMEVVNQNAIRGNPKEPEASSVQLRSSENRSNISEIRNSRCPVNNSMYSSNQTIPSFNSVPEHNSNMTFDNNTQKRSKENVYNNNKNNTGIACKYTIDSLFKNGDMSRSQVNINSDRDKVPDNSAVCKSHIHKRNSAPYEIEGLPLVNEHSLNHGQNQLYQNETNHYAITPRESANMCGNMVGNNMRNEMGLANNGCSMTQPADIHNSNNCKTSANNIEKNDKIYNNVGSDANFNKNDPILMSSADLLKSKELDRNNFMPLLDDVRLTTDFSSDLFSSFQVAPGGQHPESMSPTAAFLLAFPLVSTSKNADNINETDNPEHNSATPTTILQIGNIDQPNPDMFHSQVEGLRSKQVEEPSKEYERYTHYDGNMYENVQVESSKRKPPQNQSFTDQSNSCVDKNCRRTCDTRKRSRTQSELPTYSQSYAYPIFPNNNEYAQFTNPVTDPKADGISVPWTMNLNQDFSTQTVQKDVCTSTTKTLKSGERKNSKSEKQTLKNANYSCSQQGSQTVDYYASKPERKKQKNSHTKTPVNWMAPTEPVKNTFIEPTLSQIDVYQNNKEQDANLLSNNQNQNVYNNIVSSLEVPFDTACFSDFGNKKSNNYSWSPSKSLLPALDSHNFVIPSTLPTLVGDLALGTSTPAETFKSFEDNRKFEQPKKADKSSSTFLDNASATQTNSSSSNPKKRVDYSTKTQANSNSFLSVSQLVDPKSQKQSKINEIKNIKRNENNSNKEKFQNCQNINNSRREQQEQNCIYDHRNEVPSNCWNDKQQQKIQYKGNYSAESLIAAQPTSDTPESFHLNFNSYQAQNNYFHSDFTESNQLQQGQQYQNYFNQGTSHFSSFLGEEYTHEFASAGSQRKKKTKENSSVYPSGIHSKDTFVPLQKDNSGYLNSLPKESSSYQAPGLLSQGYRNCIKIGVPHVGQQSNPTSTLTNFNLSTIFPEINDQRVSGGSSQPPHINPNFSSLSLHNYPSH